MQVKVFAKAIARPKPQAPPKKGATEAEKERYKIDFGNWKRFALGIKNPTVEGDNPFGAPAFMACIASVFCPVGACAQQPCLCVPLSMQLRWWFVLSNRRALLSIFVFSLMPH